MHFNAWFLDLLTFSKSSNAVLKDMVDFFIMSVKLAALGLLKIKIFWNKGHDVIIYVYDVTKILSLELNYILEVVMWPKFDNSSISMTETIMTSSL